MSQIIKHEANSIPVGQRQADGYVNATALCKAAGKRWDNYRAHAGYQPFIDALARSLKVSDRDLVESIKGGKVDGQGTWVHPQVAVHLAMWLSPEFSVLVTQWVVAWTTGKQTPPAPQGEQKALGPSHYYPEVSQAVFDTLPYLDRVYMSESPAERAARIRRESPEIWRQ